MQESAFCELDRILNKDRFNASTPRCLLQMPQAALKVIFAVNSASRTQVPAARSAPPVLALLPSQRTVLFAGAFLAHCQHQYQ